MATIEDVLTAVAQLGTELRGEIGSLGGEVDSLHGAVGSLDGVVGLLRDLIAASTPRSQGNSGAGA